MDSASPPLFPGPAKTITRRSKLKRCSITLLMARDARCMRTREVVDSLFIVYASSSRSCFEVKIFINANIVRFRDIQTVFCTISKWLRDKEIGRCILLSLVLQKAACKRPEYYDKCAVA